mmetsp:Transcript_17639/g.49945  ORF Transcript_17639/g.49945 Transcript_17639/m.49945 type:complete len:442 (-) Transcript_17639:60-1385(-)
MPPQVTTSLEAFRLAGKLCDDYDRRKQREKEMNVRKSDDQKKPPSEAVPQEDGPSRVVTEIDYKKHEGTVRELNRQEEEEERARKSAEASQWCTLDHEHGPNCRRPVGGCSHDHQKEWAIYDKSTEEKINAADRFRQEGNEAYRKHNYGLAAVHYRKALLQFDYTFADTDEEEKLVDDVKERCLLNLAACKCQQEEWDEVLTQCRLALEINPRSVKAFYRTGQAHLARDQFELATDSLRSAHELEPQNPEVHAALKQLRKNMARYKARQREVFREMVVRGADGGEEETGADGDGKEGAAMPDAKPPAAGAGPVVAESATAAQPAEGGRAPNDAQATDVPHTARGASAGGDGQHSCPDGDKDADSARRPDEPSGSCGTEEPSAVLRRRGGAPARVDGDHDEGDAEEVEDKLSLPPSKLLNCILILAVCLGTFSVAVLAVVDF